MSLDEANAIFEYRHAAELEAIKVGDAFFIFEADGVLKFDENSRGVFPFGRMAIKHKLC